VRNLLVGHLQNLLFAASDACDCVASGPQSEMESSSGATTARAASSGIVKSMQMTSPHPVWLERTTA